MRLSHGELKETSQLKLGPIKLTPTQRRYVADMYNRAGIMLLESSTRGILYKSMYGVRVPYAYVVWRSGSMCRHRDAVAVNPRKRNRVVKYGPLCGDVWEHATLNLKTDKVISAVCFMHKHDKPIKRKS